MVQHNAGMQDQIKILSRHGQPVFVSGVLCGWLSRGAVGQVDGNTIKFTLRSTERRGLYNYSVTEYLVLERRMMLAAGSEFWFLTAVSDDLDLLPRLSGFVKFDEAIHGGPVMLPDEYD